MGTTQAARRYGISFAGIAGCVLGVTITMLVKLICLPSSHHNWPNYMESRQRYERILGEEHYSYRNGKELYTLSIGPTGADFNDEVEFLKSRVRFLCYVVDIDAENAEHLVIIIKSWAKNCDKTLVFYSNKKLEVMVKGMRDVKLVKTNVELVHYVSGANHTIKSLLDYVQPLAFKYDWIIYVPANVYFIPDNMRYYIIASEADHRKFQFIGKPHVTKLTGMWSISDESPLAISQAAILHAAKNTNTNCLRDSLIDPLCLLESCNSHLVNLKDEDGNDVFETIFYGNMLVQYLSAEADKIKTRFPASIYIEGLQGTYKRLLDLEYYISHLNSFGVRPTRGSYTHLNK